MRAAFLFGLAAALTCVGAADAPTWVVAASGDGRFTVSTPCTPAEVDALRRTPGDLLPSPNIGPDARVLCRSGSLNLVAYEIAASAVPPGVPSLFDLLASQSGSRSGSRGAPGLTSVGGRRALLELQRDGAEVVQNGIVEMDATHVLLLVAGGDAQAGPLAPAAEQQAAIDRFYGSVRIVR